MKVSARGSGECGGTATEIESCGGVSGAHGDRSLDMRRLRTHHRGHTDGKALLLCATFAALALVGLIRPGFIPVLHRWRAGGCAMIAAMSCLLALGTDWEAAHPAEAAQMVKQQAAQDAAEKAARRVNAPVVQTAHLAMVASQNAATQGSETSVDATCGIFGGIAIALADPLAASKICKAAHQKPRTPQAIDKATFEKRGDRWPFTIDHGRVGCSGDSPTEEYWFEGPDGARFGLNGLATQDKGYADLNSVWLFDDTTNAELNSGRAGSGAHFRIDIGPMIDAAKAACGND